MATKTLSIIILFSIFLIGSINWAQLPIQHIEVINDSKGLSSNEVNSIIQDRNGFLWIGTQYGLNRYDGDEIKQYYSDKEKKGLSDNTIIKILSLSPNHLLLATRKGIDLLDTRNYTFKKITFPKFSDNPKDQNLNQHIYFLEQDFNGNIWVATPIHIYRFNKNLQLQKVFYSGYNYTDIVKNGKRWVYKLLPLKDGSMLIWLKPDKPFVWLPNGKEKLIDLDKMKDSKYGFIANKYHKKYFRAGTQYLAYVDYQNRILKIIDVSNGQSASCLLPLEYQGKQESLTHISMLKNNWIAVCFDNQGLAWIHLNYKNGVITLNSDQTVYFSDYNIEEIFEDRENNLFLADRQKGVIKIAKQKQKFKTIDLNKLNNGKTSSYEINSFLKDGNELWIATYGDGIYRWNETTGQIKKISLITTTMWSDYIWNFSNHSKDTLWVGTQTGLFWLHKQNGHFGRIPQNHPKVLDSVAITTNFVDSKGLVWMGLGNTKGLCTYHRQKNNFECYSFKDGTFPYKYPPSGVVEDKESNIWLSVPTTSDLVKWIRKENRFEIIHLSDFQDIDQVNLGRMEMDQKNNFLWLGIKSAGLVRYDLTTGKTKFYESGLNLHSNDINGITIDNSGKIWLSTNLGLASFHPKTEKFINYKSSDGLAATYLASNLLYDKQTQQIFSGSLGNVIYFSPDSLTNYSKIQARITDVQIRNLPISIPVNKYLNLKSKDNDVSIYFTGVNLTNGDENQYAYRIRDDDDWISIGNQNQVHLANLSPGEYLFSVKVAAKDSDWSDLTDTIRITIHQPFYATFWFYLILSLFVYGIIYGLYQYRLTKIKQLAMMRSQISHDLHDEIGSSLTNISMMSQILGTKKINIDQQGQWLDKIKKESEQISQDLREIVWNINPDNDSLEEAMPRMLKYAADILEAKEISIHTQISELKNIR